MAKVWQPYCRDRNIGVARASSLRVNDGGRGRACNSMGVTGGYGDGDLTFTFSLLPAAFRGFDAISMLLSHPPRHSRVHML